MASATILLTEAESGPTYVLIGVLGGAVFITVRYLLTDYSLLRRVFTVAVAVSMFVVATRHVTGKLAMIVGACLSTIVVSYYLETRRE